MLLHVIKPAGPIKETKGFISLQSLPQGMENDAVPCEHIKKRYLVNGA